MKAHRQDPIRIWVGELPCPTERIFSAQQVVTQQAAVSHFHDRKVKFSFLLFLLLEGTSCTTLVNPELVKVAGKIIILPAVRLFSFFFWGGGMEKSYFLLYFGHVIHVRWTLLCVLCVARGLAIRWGRWRARSWFRVDTRFSRSRSSSARATPPTDPTLNGSTFAVEVGFPLFFFISIELT